MTSIRGQGRPVQRNQASEASTGPPSSNGNYKDPLGSNELGPFETPTGFEAPAGPFEAPPVPPQASPLPIFQDPGANHYS